MQIRHDAFLLLIDDLHVFGFTDQHAQQTVSCPTVRDGLKAVLSRQRQRRGKAAMSLTEVRQGRELEAEARQTKFEARPRRGDS